MHVDGPFNVDGTHTPCVTVVTVWFSSRERGFERDFARGHSDERPKLTIFSRRTRNDGEEKMMSWEHREFYLKNQ